MFQTSEPLSGPGCGGGRKGVTIGVHPVDLFPDVCGAQNVTFRVFGVYKGCYRWLGDVNTIGDEPYFTEVASGDDGWPLIRTSRHWGGGLGAGLTYQFVRGQFAIADEYTSYPDDDPPVDLRRMNPPFCVYCPPASAGSPAGTAACQFD